MRSFRVYKDEQPFTTFKISRQTVYWTILILVIIFVQLWIIQVQLDIANLTDSLNAAN